MSELEEAARRLEEAVARLETAATRRASERKPPTKGNAGSGETAAIVAARLDDAILRLDRLLEN
jgi:hypothetical protein